MTAIELEVVVKVEGVTATIVGLLEVELGIVVVVGDDIHDMTVTVFELPVR